MFRFIDNLCAINVKYRELDPELYDKIDAFPFYIVRVSFWDSNMPTRIFLAAVGSWILRLARKTYLKETFKTLITTLLMRMHRQGFLNTN